MPRPVLIDTLTFRGGMVAVYAAAEAVMVLTLDQVGLATYRPASTEVLRTAAALVEHAAHVSTGQPQLCVLLCRAWREHVRLADEARTIDTTCVVLTGAPA